MRGGSDTYTCTCGAKVVAMFLVSLLCLPSLSQDTLSVAGVGADTLVVTGLPVDTVTVSRRMERLSQAKRVILPASLIAVGSIGLIRNSPIQKVSQHVHNSIGNGKLRHTSVDDYIQYTPLALNVCLSLGGVKSKHSFLDRFFAAGGAYVCTFALTNGLKYTVREKRPDTGGRNSFPSGHTAMVFTGAEIVRTEFGPWCGLAAYSVACTVGVLRVTNDRHWCHDVLAGAGIGILSARVGYWMLPVWKRVFPFKDKGRGMSCLPVYNPYDNSLAVSCNILL